MNFTHNGNYGNSNFHRGAPVTGSPAIPAPFGPKEKDTRFADILGPRLWHSLPETVRCRFSIRLGPGQTKIYLGNVVSTRISRAGWLLAQLARLVGAPLPTSSMTGRATVCVNEDPLFGGQVWQRTYERPGRSPQVIHSAKRFRGVTGLEEYIGSGIGMTLRLTVERDALVFTSTGYFLEAGRWRLEWPRILSPGVMRIVHRDERSGWFSFTLTLDHPRLGRLLEQVVHFKDSEEDAHK